MILPAKERVMRTIRKKLEGIKIANGYTVDIAQVLRTRNIPERCDNPPTIYMIRMREIPEFRGSHMTMWHMPIILLLAAQPYGEEGEDYDLALMHMETSIYQALNSGPNASRKVFDYYNPSKEIYITELSNEPGYDQTNIPNIAGGQIRLMVQYWTPTDDPNRYDWDEQPVDD